MEGIRLTGQSLYSDNDPEEIKEQAHSILFSKGYDTDDIQGTLNGETFLNSVEVRVRPHEDGAYINVDYGMTTIGVLLTVIFLVLGAVIGIILILLWYIKYDELKGTFRHAFPSFATAPPQQYQYPEGPQS